VATFDCLHDMGDPLGAARHVLQALAPDGTWILVEPYAADDTASNLNLIGRCPTLLCHAVRAERAVPARRLLTRSAGRRGCHPAGRDGRRARPVSSEYALTAWATPERADSLDQAF